MKPTISLKRRALPVCIATAVAFSTAASAGHLEIDRSFTGIWEQTDHDNQGFVINISKGPAGGKLGSMMWFTYGDDMETAWYLAVGPVQGHEILMKLYNSSGVGFMQESSDTDDEEQPDPVYQIGEIIVSFDSCEEGIVGFDTPADVLGTGEIRIKRLTRIYDLDCDVDDDDDDDDFDDDDFDDDYDDGDYEDDDDDDDDFDDDDDDDDADDDEEDEDDDADDDEEDDADDDDGDDDDDDDADDDGDDSDTDVEPVRIDISLASTGVIRGAEGDAEYEVDRDGDSEFSVDISEVPRGSYGLQVGGELRGTIVTSGDADESDGEIVFTMPRTGGSELLDFDPRGQQIRVLSGSDVILEATFPAN